MTKATSPTKNPKKHILLHVAIRILVICYENLNQTTTVSHSVVTILLRRTALPVYPAFLCLNLGIRSFLIEEIMQRCFLFTILLREVRGKVDTWKMLTRQAYYILLRVDMVDCHPSKTLSTEAEPMFFEG